MAKTLERDPKDAAHWSTTYVWTQPAEDIIERLTGYLKWIPDPEDQAAGRKWPTSVPRKWPARMDCLKRTVEITTQSVP